MKRAVAALALVAAAVPLAACDPVGTRSSACLANKAKEPSGAIETRIDDVDHDGRRDWLWVAEPTPEGGRPFGVRTASGRVITEIFGTTAPFPIGVFAANADRRGPVEIFVQTRGLYVYAFIECRIVPVRIGDNDPLVFGLFIAETETGIACEEREGRRQLVRLKNLDAFVDSPTTVVHWERTPIVLNGSSATSGATESGEYHLPADQAKVDALARVSCGPESEATYLMEPNAL